MADQKFTVNLEVPHAGGRAWHWVVAEFGERLSDQVIPPVLSADLVAEIRRGRDGLRLRIAVIVQAADIAEAVGVAWDVLETASEAGGFHLASATVDAGPAPLVLSSYRGLAASMLYTDLAHGDRAELVQRQAAIASMATGHALLAAAAAIGLSAHLEPSDTRLEGGGRRGPNWPRPLARRRLVVHRVIPRSRAAARRAALDHAMTGTPALGFPGWAGSHAQGIHDTITLPAPTGGLPGIRPVGPPPRPPHVHPTIRTRLRKGGIRSAGLRPARPGGLRRHQRCT
jgi:hypothetical protein